MFPLGSSDPEGNTFFEDRPLSFVSGMTLNTTGRYASLKVRITFLGGIMLSFIKNNKYFALILLLVFTPTSKLVFGVFGIAAGFVNWGLLILVGIVVLGVKLNNKYDLRAMLSSSSDEEDDTFI
jgi:di/tricarboxylate transporter